MTFKRTDLPQFTVGSIEQGERDCNGDITLTLHGGLNRTSGISIDRWCYLLLPNQTCLTGWFTFSEGSSAIASFATSAKEKPEIIGITLSQLDSYWQPYHIWMVEQGPQGWSEQVFSPSDAIEDTFIASDGRSWRRLAKADSMSADHSTGSLQGVKDPSRTRIVPGGWDHEHCSLCNAHIDPGDRFFYSLEYCQFLCVTCYERYVPTRDIGFVFE